MSRSRLLCLETLEDRIAPAAELTAAAGAMNFLRALDDPVTTAGLPRNEAKQSELNAGSFSAGYFVPAELGAWLTGVVLSNDYRKQDGTFAAGLTDQQLLTDVTASENSLDNILNQYAFTDPGTGGKALYQVHYTPSGVAPRSNDFEKTVSLLDNAELVAGLQSAANYLHLLVPDPGVDIGSVRALANRLDATIARFNFRMWFDGINFHLGGPENPLLGSVLDRITSEGRLAIVVAAAHGDISAAEFAGVIGRLISQSHGGASAGGTAVQDLPFFGTALESWAVTPYLSGERATFYGSTTLYPLAAAVLDTSARLGLPAAGAEGVSNGFGAYDNFALAPAEGSSTYLNDKVLIPPAAGGLAGVLENPPLPQLQNYAQQASQNFAATLNALQNANQLDPTWGVPNYLDFGSGLVNESNPVRGFLEVGQMATALLNGLLGGQYLESMLRLTPGWALSLDQYFNLLNVREAEFQPSGAGYSIPRSNAGGGTVWHLSSAGQQVDCAALVGTAGSYSLVVRYSNNDAGPGDDVTVLVSGKAVGTFHTAQTNDWNIFTTSPSIALGALPAGPVTISFRLASTDGYGVDLDNLQLTRVVQNAVPAGWSDGDVGGPTLAGFANYDAAAGTWTVTGSGTDVWNTSDQFQFASQAFTGDGSLTARVTALQNTDPWAKAGVMFRDSTAANAPFADVVITPGNGINFQWRATAGGSATGVQVTGVPGTAWVQLTRTGSVFRAFYSTDDVNWTAIGSPQTIAMSSTVRAGLAVTAHTNAALNRASFVNVALVPPGWSDGDIGSPGRPGGADFDPATGSWTVAGGGSDIWGTADHFHFVSQGLPGDGTVVASVTAVQVTDPWAKAGVMIRAGSDPAAAFADVVATPGNGVAFQWRSTAGGPANDVHVTGLAALGWVKLSRVGNTFSGYYSSDGVTWNPIGSGQTIVMPATATAGLAVSAHGNALVNTSTFSNVAVTPAPATRFVLSAPAKIAAGSPFTVTLTALDAYGNPVVGYRGTVHFTSTDKKAVLAADYTFTAADGGVHAFAGVVLKTSGGRTITAADLANASVAGSAKVSVQPGAATHFKIVAPASVTAGSAFDVTVRALDAYGNLATGYQGTVHFSSSDTRAGVILPTDYTFLATDKGKHTFTGLTLVTPGTQTVRVADKANSLIKGTAKIAVNAATEPILDPGGTDDGLSN